MFLASVVEELVAVRACMAAVVVGPLVVIAVVVAVAVVAAIAIAVVVLDMIAVACIGLAAVVGSHFVDRVDAVDAVDVIEAVDSCSGSRLVAVDWEWAWEVLRWTASEDTDWRDPLAVAAQDSFDGIHLVVVVGIEIDIGSAKEEGEERPWTEGVVEQTGLVMGVGHHIFLFWTALVRLSISVPRLTDRCSSEVVEVGHHMQRMAVLLKVVSALSVEGVAEEEAVPMLDLGVVPYSVA